MINKINNYLVYILIIFIIIFSIGLRIYPLPREGQSYYIDFSSHYYFLILLYFCLPNSIKQINLLDGLQTLLSASIKAIKNYNFLLLLIKIVRLKFLSFLRMPEARNFYNLILTIFKNYNFLLLLIKIVRLKFLSFLRMPEARNFYNLILTIFKNYKLLRIDKCQ